MCDARRLNLVEQVCQYLEANSDTTPSLIELGEQFHVSGYYLQRIFKHTTGITPKQYTDAQRINKLKARLRDGDNVTDALYDVGYGSSSRLYESAPRKMGMTPAIYSRGGEGMHIYYTIVECHLGLLLIGITEKGICAVYRGDNPDELNERLFGEYPSANIEQKPYILRKWVTVLLEHLEGRVPHLELPLDIQSTAFEKQVHDYLLRIPYGETRTYDKIATDLGQPNAVADVARICATNPTQVLIPTHRVVREDGQPSEYDPQTVATSRRILLENEQNNARHNRGEE